MANALRYELESSGSNVEACRFNSMEICHSSRVFPVLAGYKNPAGTADFIELNKVATTKGRCKRLGDSARRVHVAGRPVVIEKRDHRGPPSEHCSSDPVMGIALALNGPRCKSR